MILSIHNPIPWPFPVGLLSSSIVRRNIYSVCSDRIDPIRSSAEAVANRFPLFVFNLSVGPLDRDAGVLSDRLPTRCPDFGVQNFDGGAVNAARFCIPILLRRKNTAQRNQRFLQICSVE